MSAPRAEYLIVSPEDFPFGVACPGCMRTLLPGDPYHKVPYEMAGDTMCLIVQCVYCH